MTYEVAGRKVLVTGASSGIGAGLAEAFAKAGATVGLCARREQRLKEVLERCRTHSPDSQMWVTDLSDLAAVDALAAEVLKAFGRIDVLVNNAGIPKRRHVSKLDPETVDAVMRINYSSPVRLTLALLPQMIARGEGRIINVSSVAAPLSSPNEAAYDASKAALASFSEAMTVDLWDDGVRGMVVYPGVVDTELFSLPDNEPMIAQVDPISVDEAVGTIMEAFVADALQVYVPTWFADLATGKAANVEEFLAGAAEFVRQQKSGS